MVIGPALKQRNAASETLLRCLSRLLGRDHLPVAKRESHNLLRGNSSEKANQHF